MLMTQLALLDDMLDTDAGVYLLAKKNWIKKSRRYAIFSKFKVLFFSYGFTSVKRVFSDLNNIKTDIPNNLSQDNLSVIISTKQSINETGRILTFNPSKAMLCAKIW
jgi:hypothetical protein